MVFASWREGAMVKMVAVNLRAVLILGDRAAGIAQRLRIGARQVGADLLPALAFVGGLPEMLRRRVEHLRIERRKHDRERPLPALLQRARGHAGEEQRIHLHVAHLAGASGRSA